MKQIARLAFAVSLVALLPVVVNAAAIKSINWTAASGLVNWVSLDAPEPSVEPDEDGLFSESWSLTLKAPGDEADLQIDGTISGDVHPVLNGEFDVYNFANVDVTFSLAFDMNSAPMAGPTQTSGSIDIGLVDRNFNGVTLSSSGPDPVYQSLIDGADHHALMSHVYSLTTAVPGGTTNDSASFSGLPGGAVASTLGTELVFTLSGGDYAHITTNFTVVPEPASSVLLGMGLVCLVGFMARQRKSGR